eukprot:m.27840 g.27840  ORF g.27840 m.27840 type:complete len:395 (-) comp15820_c0_seq1:115-1299(-)
MYDSDDDESLITPQGPGSINSPESEDIDEDKVQTKKRSKAVVNRIIACLTLCGMLATWILEIEFGKALTEGCSSGNTSSSTNGSFDNVTAPEGLCYQHNFFIVYCTRFGASMVFVGWLIWRKTRAPEISPFLKDGKLRKGKGLGAFDWYTYCKLSLALGLALFASTYTWYISFESTSAGGNSAVYQSAPIFVFLFSVPILKEKVTILKVVSVCICVGGVVGVILLSESGGGGTAGGYMWLLLSVLLYSGFEVFYKKYACSDQDPHPIANAQRFFGMCGLACVLTLWPMFFILDAVGLEKFELPVGEMWGHIITLVLCDTLFNTFLVLTILLSSPLFAAVGTNLVIPSTIVVEYLWHGTTVPPLSYIGIVGIAIGFSGMVYAEYREHKASRQTHG